MRQEQLGACLLASLPASRQGRQVAHQQALSILTPKSRQGQLVPHQQALWGLVPRATGTGSRCYLPRAPGRRGPQVVHMMVAMTTHFATTMPRRAADY